MADTELHAWLRPRVTELMQQAEARGFAHDLVLAVLIDLVTGSDVNDAPLPDEPPIPQGPWPQPPNDDLTEVRPEVGDHLPDLLGDIRGRAI